jgi:hypothetical protein
MKKIRIMMIGVALIFASALQAQVNETLESVARQNLLILLKRPERFQELLLVIVIISLSVPLDSVVVVGRKTGKKLKCPTWETSFY